MLYEALYRIRYAIHALPEGYALVIPARGNLYLLDPNQQKAEFVMSHVSLADFIARNDTTGIIPTEEMPK